MKKNEIENSEAWRYIKSLSPTGRYEALFGKSSTLIQNEFNCSIEERLFVELKNVADDELILSVQRDSNMMCITVLKLNP